LQLCEALDDCIATALYGNNIEDLAAFFEAEGKQVNAKLKQLVGSIIVAKLESWREGAISSRVSLPKYMDVNWAINMKKASSEVLSVSVHLNFISYSANLSRFFLILSFRFLL
jgi:hypothetical protein